MYHFFTDNLYFYPVLVCSICSASTAGTSTRLRTYVSRSRWSRATRVFRRSWRGPTPRRAPGVRRFPRRLPTSSPPTPSSASGTLEALIWLLTWRSLTLIPVLSYAFLPTRWCSSLQGGRPQAPHRPPH